MGFKETEQESEEKKDPQGVRGKKAGGTAWRSIWYQTVIFKLITSFYLQVTCTFAQPICNQYR